MVPFNALPSYLLIDMYTQQILLLIRVQ